MIWMNGAPLTARLRGLLKVAPGNLRWTIVDFDDPAQISNNGVDGARVLRPLPLEIVRITRDNAERPTVDRREPDLEPWGCLRR